MKTINIFRAAVNMILDSTPGLLQKTVAKKINDTVAHESTAISDFNDFIKGRKNYSLEKQERLAEILGYNYIDLLLLGRSLIEDKNKIKNIKGQYIQRKVILRDGTSCTYATILKMAEQVLLTDGIDRSIQKSILIEQIIENWRELERAKHAI